MTGRVLLLGAEYYGTLAAARAFGKRGFFVTMADENKNARALYSRHVSEKAVHPPLTDPEAVVAWLVAWGERHPGTLLYPPNDHFAWLFAAHREELGRVFLLWSPSEETILSLLDKKRLHEACADVGIDVPVTHALGDAGDADPVVDTLRWPVLLKPRTQVFLETGVKGFIANERASLGGELARFRQLVRHNRVLTERHPDIGEPMVQEYLTAAETNIFSVAGFAAPVGDRPAAGLANEPGGAVSIVARASMKVLQRPRKVGIGLCFEGRAIEEPLVKKLEALFAKVGYAGAFEAEFIADGDARLLIDVNPRFYSQMAFELARGVPLPLLVWHAARGERAAVDELMEEARDWRATGDEAYCHKTMLDLVLALQGASGRMSRDDVRRWRAWHRARGAAVTDAVRDPDDRMPAIVDAASWATHFAKHPRSFVRSFVLNR